MRTSEKVFAEIIGRPPTVEDGALVYMYDGVEDRIEFSTYGSLDIMNQVLGYGVAEHVKHVNELMGKDVTADILRAIFEAAKARLARGSDGSN